MNKSSLTGDKVLDLFIGGGFEMEEPNIMFVDMEAGMKDNVLMVSQKAFSTLHFFI